MFAADITSIPFVAHPEVWFLVIGSLSIAWYARHVIEPKAVAAGYEAITKRQKTWYFLALGSMWLASDWPVHDIAEGYLYSVHMLQHMLISMIIPAMFLMSVPRWMFELVIPPDSGLWRALRWLVGPLRMFVIFNGLTSLLHWSATVQLSYDSGAAHLMFHTMIFISGVLMWMPVCGPIEEWKLEPFAQCIYLFSMSIVPTVPGGWLVFADGVVYRHYDIVDRLFGIGVLSDQQGAGAIMKIVGGFFLWGVIVVIYGRHAKTERERDDAARMERDRERLSILSFNEVAEAFDSSVAVVES